MARLGTGVALLLVLCSGAALAAPLRVAGVSKPFSSATGRRLLGQDWFGHGRLSSFLANRWLAHRGITTATATATATATTLSGDPTLNSLIRTDAFAAARAITGPGMDMDQAAWSLMSAAQAGATAAVGNVFAHTAVLDQGCFTEVFAKSAATAMNEGADMQAGFSSATAAAFAAASAQGSIPSFAMRVADAMAQARSSWGSEFGSEFARMVGSAMAQAVAAGNDGAVVDATASVFCSGTTAQAQAWSEAVAQSMRVNPVTGCAIVQRVVARAQAMCTNGVATATAQSFVTRQVLPGTCNVFGWTTGGSFPAQQQGGARAFASAQSSSTFGGAASSVAASVQQFP